MFYLLELLFKQVKRSSFQAHAQKDKPDQGNIFA